MAIDRLKEQHNRHIRAYDPKKGHDNVRRLVGHHESSFIGNFTVGVADMNASIRIPRHVHEEKRGHMEDRRPASNCDPYVVTEVLCRTTILQAWEDEAAQMNANRRLSMIPNEK